MLSCKMGKNFTVSHSNRKFEINCGHKGRTTFSKENCGVDWFENKLQKHEQIKD